jgi:hypothetical protein
MMLKMTCTQAGFTHNLVHGTLLVQKDALQFRVFKNKENVEVYMALAADDLAAQGTGFREALEEHINVLKSRLAYCESMLETSARLDVAVWTQRQRYGLRFKRVAT